MYSKIKMEYQKLVQEASSIQSQLKHLPDGKLICVQNGKYTKWFHSHEGHITYIPKSTQDFAEKLAIKTYLSRKLQDIRHEMCALEFYLRHHKDSENTAESLLSKSSPYAPLLSSHFSIVSEELGSWMNEPYEHNSAFPEQCIHKTCLNLLVRSKSEAQIAMLLYTNKIPFRYEAPLILGDHTIYPDFTIRHPVTGDFYYWEHFGLMDNEDYRRNTFAKLQLYSNHGINPGIHLITTYETKNHPLNYEAIESLIKLHLL